MNEKVTIAIDRKHDKILEKLCKIHKCTKKDFVCSAIIFFEKNNISPIDESPEQYNKLHRKLDSVISFIRHQEKEFLRPLCESLASTDERIKIYLEVLPSKNDLKNISDKIQLVNSNIHENKSLLSQNRLVQEQSFLVLTQAIDEKNKGLSDKIKNIFNR
ncbi:hypothetical protein JGH11_03300 [Dysgonomonas sp. Marseille-P4677]|uniref:BfmA/BtgA family mobilization protein n=1 Tax=Dysgonomonas sp. Marseille-P4677 TaxID=2364790 RepID=UPI001913DB67|nr:BfmA/BtgA family mobilization protein [Dysgonomonas sp. Marseille-P4677]MBK5719890.1 hypothetical protein [Dysgonomonas sp. Marseille-P4677]